MKKILNHIFVDGLSGMVSGLFATLIIGTIISQIGALVGGSIGAILGAVGFIAKVMTGAGIGVAVACKFKAKTLVVVSAGVCGMIGAHATSVASGALASSGAAVSGSGEPLGAFIASLVCIEIGNLVADKTKLDIFVTPLCSIAAGATVGVVIASPIAKVLNIIGELIIWSTEQQPLLMGILVAVIMGLIFTSPISPVAISAIWGLKGISAGAATIGCCAHMISFAVGSFRDNGISGLVSQGIGTSMLQLPNIVKKPVISLPAIITSAILGPIGTCVLSITNNSIGSGIGNTGFAGPIMSYEVMVAEGHDPVKVLIMIGIMYFLAPAVLSAALTTFMRKNGWIKPGDMKIEI